MSREFGEYQHGYFHDKIRSAAEDCRTESDNKLTHLYGELLEELYKIAYQISNFEACDSGFYAPVQETMQRMPALKAKLREIEEFVATYKDVADNAVRDYINEQEDK